MAYIVMTYIGLAHIVMAYVGTAYVVACMAMAYVAIAKPFDERCDTEVGTARPFGWLWPI